MAIEPNAVAERRKLVHVSRMPVRWRDMDINRHADGYTRMVWIDRGTGRSQPLPDNVRALLA